MQQRLDVSRRGVEQHRLAGPAFRLLPVVVPQDLYLEIVLRRSHTVYSTRVRMGSLNGTVGETECVRIERIGRLGLNTTDDQVMLVSDESSRLHEYLSGLAQDAWSRPSACGAWEVRDVVAHLAAGSQFYADTISRGSVGDHSAPEGRPTAGSVDYTGPYSKVVAQRGIDVRESLSGHVLDEYETSNEALNLLFGSLGPAEWERQCYHPSCLHPARRFVAFRMLELALHAGTYARSWTHRPGFRRTAFRCWSS